MEIILLGMIAFAVVMLLNSLIASDPVASGLNSVKVTADKVADTTGKIFNAGKTMVPLWAIVLVIFAILMITK